MDGRPSAAAPRFEELLSELRWEYERVARQLQEERPAQAACDVGGLRLAALAASSPSPIESPKAAREPEPALDLLELEHLPGQVLDHGGGPEDGGARRCFIPGVPLPDTDPAAPSGRASAGQQLDVDNAKDAEGAGSRDISWLSNYSPSVSKRAKDMRKSVTEMFSATGEIFPRRHPQRRGEEGEPGRLHQVVSSPSFELFWSIVILTSTMLMAVEAQYDGMQAAWDYALTEPKPSAPASERWPGASAVFTAAGWLFGVLFTLELSIRFVALRTEFCMDPWGWIDIFAVAFWFVERASEAFLPVDTRVIRVTRLVKLMRFLRIIKFINAFEKLYLMVASIRSSFSALAWSAAVLFLVEVIISLLLNLLLEGYWENSANPLEGRQEIYRYFGTFTKALLSMFEMLLGNWYTITRALIQVSEWYAVFGVLHQLVMGFAVIEVITGVFLHETFQVASLDDGIMTNETKRAIKSHTAKLKVFFQNADRDANGLLDHDELDHVLQRQKVQEWLSAMGLDVRDVAMAFSVFDENKDGMISAEEFVTGAMRLKGPARAIDLAVLQCNVDELTNKLKILPIK